jgi:CRP-like cAMP-binding protein
VHTDAVQTRQVVLDGLARSYLFDAVTRDELAPLAETATTRTLVRGEFLWHPGDPANELYVVSSGEVKAFLTGSNGEELVHLMHGPGMTLGEPGYFSIERTRSVADMAVAPTVVIRLDRRELEPFMRRHPQVKDRALEGLAGMLRWYGGVVMALEMRPLRDRIVQRLLDLVDERLDGGEARTASISQSTLAGMTGVSRENVNRALAALMSDGTIRRDGARYVLVDEARLRADIARDWPVPGLPDGRRHA